MKVTKERLSYLKQAQYVQRLAEPYIRKGKLPLWKIHTKFVIEEAPVSLNTFRKMLKEDVSHLNEKIEIISQTDGGAARPGGGEETAQTYQKQITARSPATPAGAGAGRSGRRASRAAARKLIPPKPKTPPHRHLQTGRETRKRNTPAGNISGRGNARDRTRPNVPVIHVARRTSLRRNGRYLYLIHGAFLSSQFLTSTARSLLSASAPR